MVNAWQIVLLLCWVWCDQIVDRIWCKKHLVFCIHGKMVDFVYRERRGQAVCTGLQEIRVIGSGYGEMWVGSFVSGWNRDWWMVRSPKDVRRICLVIFMQERLMGCGFTLGYLEYASTYCTYRWHTLYVPLTYVRIVRTSALLKYGQPTLTRNFSMSNEKNCRKAS